MGYVTELFEHKLPPVICQNGKIGLGYWPPDVFLSSSCFPAGPKCTRVPVPKNTFVQPGLSVYEDTALKCHIRLGTVAAC